MSNIVVTEMVPKKNKKLDTKKRKDKNLPQNDTTDVVWALSLLIVRRSHKHGT